MQKDLMGSYSIDENLLTVGVKRAYGFGDTNALKITFDDPRWTKKYSSDGFAIRSKGVARGGKFEITVQQENIEMIRYFESISALPGNKDVVPISFTQLGTGRVFFAEQCWLMEDPERNFNKETGERVYVFDAALIEIEIEALEEFLPDI